LHVIVDFLRDISPSFTQETYDLITNNCNHFANTFAEFLTGKGIREDIVRLPEEVMSSAMGRMLVPVMESMQARLRSVEMESATARN